MSKRGEGGCQDGEETGRIRVKAGWALRQSLSGLPRMAGAGKKDCGFETARDLSATQTS